MKKLEFIAKQKELQEKQSAALQARNIDLAISLSKELSELTVAFEKTASETAIDLDAASAFVKVEIEKANSANEKTYAELVKARDTYNAKIAEFATGQKNACAGIWKMGAEKFGAAFGSKLQPHTSYVADGNAMLGQITFTTHVRKPKEPGKVQIAMLYRVKSDANYTAEKNEIRATLDAIGKTYRSSKFVLDAYNIAHKDVKDFKARGHLKLRGQGAEKFAEKYLEFTSKSEYTAKQNAAAAAAAAKVQNAEKDAAATLAQNPQSNVKTFSATGNQVTGK